MDKAEMMAALKEMLADKDFKEMLRDVVDEDSTDALFEEELKKNRENKLKRGKKLVVDDRGGITAEEKIAKKIGKASAKDDGIYHSGPARPTAERVIKTCTVCGKKEPIIKGSILDSDTRKMPHRCGKCLAGG